MHDRIVRNLHLLRIVIQKRKTLLVQSLIETDDLGSTIEMTAKKFTLTRIRNDLTLDVTLQIHIRAIIEIDPILTETEIKSTDKNTMTQETIAEVTMMIMIMTVLGRTRTEIEIADVRREIPFLPKALHVDTTLQNG